MSNDPAFKRQTGGANEPENRDEPEPDLSGLERAGREAEEEGPVGPIEETIPARP